MWRPGPTWTATCSARFSGSASITSATDAPPAMPARPGAGRAAHAGAGRLPPPDCFGRSAATRRRSACRASRASRALLAGRVRRSPGSRPAKRRSSSARAVRGRALVFASDLDGRWNDFPRHATFLPFLREAVDYLAGPGPRAAEYVVGDVPAGVPAQPGFAQVPTAGRGGRRWAAVNVDPGELDPTRMSEAEFGAAITRLQDAARLDSQTRRPAAGRAPAHLAVPSGRDACDNGGGKPGRDEGSLGAWTGRHRPFATSSTACAAAGGEPRSSGRSCARAWRWRPSLAAALAARAAVETRRQGACHFGVGCRRRLPCSALRRSSWRSAPPCGRSGRRAPCRPTQRVARYIEEREPDLDDRLVSAVEVLNGARGRHTACARRADGGRRRVAGLRRVDPSTIVPGETLRRAGLQAAAAAVAGVRRGVRGPRRRAPVVRRRRAHALPVARHARGHAREHARAVPARRSSIAARLVGNTAPVAAEVLREDTPDSEDWRPLRDGQPIATGGFVLTRRRGHRRRSDTASSPARCARTSTTSACCTRRA